MREWLARIVLFSIFFLSCFPASGGADDDPDALPQGLKATVSVDQPKVFTCFNGDEFTPPTIRMRLRVFNSSDQTITLPFASGQKFDFLIFNEGGNLVWQWSEGKFFIMVLTELIIAPGESRIFDASHVLVDDASKPLPEGIYTVIGKLAVPSRKIEGETQFSHQHLF